MNLPLYIATRYLFAKKSHNVINIISAISCIGMAVGTAALVIILSIYNGFDNLVKGMLSTVEPDLMVVPSQGKFFVPESEAYDWAYDCPQVKNMCTVLQDNVFVCYDGHQGTALVKGVDDVYIEESKLADHIRDGEFTLSRGEIPYAAVGMGFARTMGISRHFISAMELFHPQRDAQYSALNPAGALRSVKVWPGCEFTINSEIDASLVIVQMDVMRELMGLYRNEVSAVEIRLKEGFTVSDLSYVRKGLQERLGEGFKVMDRTEQNPDLYRMLRYEKASVYLIMIFISLILGFSIFGSLSMLIIEKESDIATLRAMGADDRTVKRIFTFEGWMITLLGMVAGAAVGIVFCLLQKHFGFIRMPGNFVVDAYPVILQWSDVAICIASITLIGYIIAAIPAGKAVKSHREQAV